MDWKERVLKEKKELEVKIGRLHEFLKSSEFMNLKYEAKVLLRKQHGVMLEYSSILQARLSNA